MSIPSGPNVRFIGPTPVTIYVSILNMGPDGLRNTVT